MDESQAAAFQKHTGVTAQNVQARPEPAVVAAINYQRDRLEV